ncbi:hypothetical protein HHI36_019875 [Cryptolaemus montrouzieri]|uniref:Uncharacterized protein n=1 Tax=Cryptolaemus montrouzieri TaxID=559131 RepID=A0ABD2N9S9_9CUCU
MVQRSGVYQVVQECTRITNTCASTIDLIITNDKYTKHRIHQTPKIAEHSNMTVPSDKMKFKSGTVRDMNFCELQFQLDLMDNNIWSDNDKTVDETAKHLVYIIEKTLCIHAQIRQRHPVYKWENKLWWKLNINSEISRRDIQQYYKARRGLVTL